MQKFLLLYMMYAFMSCAEKAKPVKTAFSLGKFIENKEVQLKIYDTTVLKSNDSIQQTPAIIDTVRGIFVSDGRIVRLISSPSYNLLDSLYFDLLTMEAGVNGVKLKAAQLINNADTNNFFKSKWNGYSWESNTDTLGLAAMMPSDTAKMTFIQMIIGNLEIDNSNFISIHKIRINGVVEHSSRTLTLTF